MSVAIRALQLLLTLKFHNTQKIDLVCQEILLCPAPLPAVPPVQNQKLKAECINLDGRLETYTQVVVVHLVELGARMQQTDVAGDREQEIIVERGELGQLILEHLRCRFSPLTFLLDGCLDCFRENLVRELP